MSETVESLLALLAVLSLGLILGRASLAGVSLGTSGVVFSALAAGHFGFKVPPTTGAAGVVLFVYCLGLGAGPNFLRSFVRRGRLLSIVAVAMLGTAALVAWLLGRVLQLSPDLVGGLFAGALTSTPALAAASEHLPKESMVAVAFGVAYPIGVVGVILFVHLAPRWIRAVGWNETTSGGGESDDGPIVRVLVEVANPGVVGKRLGEVAIISHANCQISRVLQGETLRPIQSAFTLQLGQRLLVVGARRRLNEVIEVLGRPCEDVNYTLDLERQRRRVVVTSKAMVGRTLKQLHLLSKFGVTISRITRQDVEFVPSPRDRILHGDALQAVGEPEGLDRFVAFAGHRERTLDETDLMSLAIGMFLGVVAGQVRVTLAGQEVSLGLAGGPLLVGLLLGHFAQIGPLQSRIPRPARMLLGDIGLALFLAHAGANAGATLAPVIRDHGWTLCWASAVMVAAPLSVGFAVSRLIPGLGALEMLGAVCGAMTSTPGLGAATSSSDSHLPATSYAAVYPLALILITLLAPLLLACLQ